MCPGVEKTIFEYVPKWLIAMIFQKYGLFMIHYKKNKLRSSIQKNLVTCQSRQPANAGAIFSPNISENAGFYEKWCLFENLSAKCHLGLIHLAWCFYFIGYYEKPIFQDTSPTHEPRKDLKQLRGETYRNQTHHKICDKSLSHSNF